MSYTMRSHVIFPKTQRRKRIDIWKVNSVNISSSWQQLTDTAEIILPRKVNIFEKYPIVDLFKTGDPVQVFLGYNDDLVEEFNGYLSDVSEGVPIRLGCENEMYMLKQKTVNVSMSNTSLKKLLEAIAPGYDINCPDGVELGSVRYAGTTPARILEDIQEQTGMYSYFDGKTLCCGVVYADQTDLPPVKVHLEKQAVSESLNRKTSAEQLIRVRAVSILKGGKKLQVEVGDSGGRMTDTLTYVGIEVESDLKKAAELDLQKKKAKGFDGSIELFGLPRIRHGMKVDLESVVYENLKGIYYADRVNKRFSDNATYRQVVELGNKTF